MLTMPVPAPIVLPALLLEDDDLPIAHLLKDRRRYPGAVDQGCTHRLPFIVANHEHLIQGHIRAFFRIELLDPDNIVLGDLVLLAAALDHCEHLTVLSCVPRPAPCQYQGRREDAKSLQAQAGPGNEPRL